MGPENLELWQIKEQSFDAIIQYYDGLMSGLEVDLEQGIIDSQEYRNKLNKIKAEDNYFRASIKYLEDFMINFGECNEYFSILNDMLNELADIVKDDRSLYNEVVSIRSKVGSEWEKFRKTAQKKANPLINEFNVPSKRILGKKEPDKLFLLRSANRMQKDFDNILNWTGAWMYGGVSPSSIILTSEDNISAEDYERSIKENYISDSNEYISYINTYKELDDRFKTGMNESELGILERDVKSLDYLSNVHYRLELISKKLHDYSKVIERIYPDFDVQKIAKPLSDLFGMVDKKKKKLYSTVMDKIEILKSDIKKSNEYENALMNYIELYKEYAELSHRDQTYLTTAEKQRLSDLKMQLDSLEKKYDLDVQGIKDGINDDIRIRNNGRQEESRPDLMLSNTVEKFKEQYPQEYRKIYDRVREEIYRRVNDGSFGQTVNVSSDTLNPQVMEKIEIEFAKLLETAVETYLKSVNQKKESAEIRKGFELDNERYAIYSELAFSRLCQSGEIRGKTIEELSEPEILRVLEVCEQYAQMSDLSPEDKAIYIATYMEPEGSNISIPKNQYGSMKTMSELTPEERLIINYHYQMIERHPEIYDLDAEYRHYIERQKGESI